MSVCCKRFLLIAALFCGFWASELRAQGWLGARGYLPSPEWKEVGTLGDQYHSVLPDLYSAFYFFDPVHGIIATTKPALYYISTQAQYGIAGRIPIGFTTIRAIRFIQGKLYAATDGPDILISIDSGKTWTYSGLGFSNANDVYADASGNIRVLTDPMKTFARVDTMHCVATGGGDIFVSSDGGLNWIQVPLVTIDPESAGVFADPCKDVFICPSSWGTAALRSTDLGQTWQTVLTGAAGP